MCEDYKDVFLPDNCIVYCDPPYNSTKSYAYQGVFDTDTFWEYAKKISQDHLVYISEQKAPNDFVSIWEKPLKRTLCKDSEGYHDITEQLFVHEKYKDLFNKKTGQQTQHE